jgi:alpha-1,2-mannosyltransferase
MGSAASTRQCFKTTMERTTSFGRRGGERGSRRGEGSDTELLAAVRRSFTASHVLLGGWPRQALGAARTDRFSYVVVFVVAFGLRLLVPLTSRGLVGNYSYDAGVYYSAGAALVHGRFPYRDFILLHPPGAMLATAPAAWIGRLTSDHTGFALATLEFTLFGAACAVLVVVVARGLGVGSRAALAGGLFYAMWFPSVRNEYLTRLEPLGNLLLLCGLAGYVGIGGRHSRRSAVLCGAALGAATSVKIWYAAPLVVVLCFLMARRRPGDAVRAVAGAVAAVVLICGPFFAVAPSALRQMVISNQLGRDQVNPVRPLLMLQQLPSGLSWQGALLLDMVLLVCAGVLLVAAWRAPAVRLPAALLLISAAVLVAGPSWFFSYFDYLTPAAALCIATGAAALGAVRRETGTLVARSCAVAGATVVAIALVIPAGRLWYGHDRARASLPSRQLAAAVTDVRCVMSDSPMALIGLDALSRNLANRCPNWIDVTGRTYASDMDVRGEDGRRVSRLANPHWQQALRRYLLSGDAVIIMRAKDAGISSSTREAIVGGGILATDGVHSVYRVDSGRD